MQPPLIAINPLHEPEEPCLRLRTRYVEAVRRAGGLPVVLPSPPADEWTRDGEIQALLERVDGLLITGGDDFDAETLGLGLTHPSAQVTVAGKQAFDLALTRMALAADLPTLGICYGMQCLGLVGGATLIQDLPDQLPGAREHRAGAVHGVRPREGTKLSEILGVEALPVVSRHHQALRTLPPPWIVSAMDDVEDQNAEAAPPRPIIEAIEHPDRRFAIGVQWHPEISLPTSPNGLQAGDSLLRALIDSSRGA